MVLRILLLSTLLLAAACSSPTDSAASGSAGGATTGPTPSAAPSGAPPSPAGSARPDGASAEQEGHAGVEGSVLRFSRGGTSIDVRLTSDHAATRALVASLPISLDLTDLSDREKIGYLPQELPTDGVPGSDPEDGDLIYFTPWGNLGFYYDASGIGFDERVIRLGTFSADRPTLDALEGDGVRVELLRSPADS